RLDWIFYWGDAIAFALLPPLLLHFTMVFPQRPYPATANHQNQNQNQNQNAERRTPNADPRSWLVATMYAPALLLAAVRVIAIARAGNGSLSGPMFSRTLEWLDRAQPLYLFVRAALALAA